MKTILIAGMGLLPVEAAKNMKGRGEEVTIITFSEQLANDFTDITNDVHVMSIGQVGRILKFIKKSGIKNLIFAGKINKTLLEQNMKFDMKALWMLARLKDRQENTLMYAIVHELESMGIAIGSQLDALSHLVVAEGVYTKKKPSRVQLDEVRFAYQKARALAGVDIGQVAITKNKTILAVESIEGTDATIRRGASFSHGGDFTFIKVAKPHQDERFDLPVVGMDTLESFVAAKGRVFAVEADLTLFIDLPGCVEYANKHDVIIVAYKDGGS